MAAASASASSQPLLAQFDAVWSTCFPPPLPTFGAISLSASPHPTTLQISSQPILKLLSQVCNNVLANPALSKFRHVTRAKVAPKLGVAGMAVLESLGFRSPLEQSGELVLAPDADLQPLRIWSDEMTKRTEEARQRERERRGYGADENTAAASAEQAAAASSSAAAVASPAVAAPLDEKSLTHELEWTRSRLEKVQSQLAALARMQLTGEASKKAYAASSRSWREWMDEIWSNPPVMRDTAVGVLLPILTHILRDPSNDRLRTFPLETKLPQLNAATGGVQFLQSLGFVFAEHTLSLPAAADLTEWPAVLVAIHSRSVQVVAQRDQGRKRGVEALANKAQSSKTQKLQANAAAAAAAASAASSSSSPASPASPSSAASASLPPTLQSLQRELAAADRKLQQVCASSGFGAPLSIDVAVVDWSAKDVDSKRRFESAPPVVDGAGRKWRAFIVKDKEHQISLFLELMSKLRSDQPLRVAVAMQALHSAAHIPCFRPSVSSPVYVQQLEFSDDTPVLGYARFITDTEILLIGAWNKQTDKLSFRVELSVQLPTTDPNKNTELDIVAL